MIIAKGRLARVECVLCCVYARAPRTLKTNWMHGLETGDRGPRGCLNDRQIDSLSLSESAVAFCCVWWSPQKKIPVCAVRQMWAEPMFLAFVCAVLLPGLARFGRWTESVEWRNASMSTRRWWKEVPTQREEMIAQSQCIELSITDPRIGKRYRLARIGRL